MARPVAIHRNKDMASLRISTSGRSPPGPDRVSARRPSDDFEEDQRSPLQLCAFCEYPTPMPDITTIAIRVCTSCASVFRADATRDADEAGPRSPAMGAVSPPYASAGAAGTNAETDADEAGPHAPATEAVSTPSASAAGTDAETNAEEGEGQTELEHRAKATPAMSFWTTMFAGICLSLVALRLLSSPCIPAQVNITHTVTPLEEPEQLVQMTQEWVSVAETFSSLASLATTITPATGGGLVGHFTPAAAKVCGLLLRRHRDPTSTRYLAALCSAVDSSFDAADSMLQRLAPDVLAWPQRTVPQPDSILDAIMAAMELDHPHTDFDLFIQPIALAPGNRTASARLVNRPLARGQHLSAHELCFPQGTVPEEAWLASPLQPAQVSVRVSELRAAIQLGFTHIQIYLKSWSQLGAPTRGAAAAASEHALQPWPPLGNGNMSDAEISAWQDTFKAQIRRHRHLSLKTSALPAPGGNSHSNVRAWLSLAHWLASGSDAMDELIELACPHYIRGSPGPVHGHRGGCLGDPSIQRLMHSSSVASAEAEQVLRAILILRSLPDRASAAIRGGWMKLEFYGGREVTIQHLLLPSLSDLWSLFESHSTRLRRAGDLLASQASAFKDFWNQHHGHISRDSPGCQSEPLSEFSRRWTLPFEKEPVGRVRPLVVLAQAVRANISDVMPAKGKFSTGGSFNKLIEEFNKAVKGI
ncbi:hypothetical protein QBC39DRAFT_375336 [Podospora conica]|nr:hypothetical protein QBC39DRAFT_375336 [Schizothecium conicum]